MLTLLEKNRLLWLIAAFLIGISLDQGSKLLVQDKLAEPYEVVEEIVVNGESTTVTKRIFYPVRVVEVIPNFLNLIYKENPAAAFSLLSSVPESFRRPLLISVSAIAILFFLFWYFRLRDGLLLFALAIIVTGAFGNLIDRIRYGYVIDFIDLHAGIFGLPHWHWPTFNVADSLIVMGAILVVIKTLKPHA